MPTDHPRVRPFEIIGRDIFWTANLIQQKTYIFSTWYHHSSEVRISMKDPFL